MPSTAIGQNRPERDRAIVYTLLSTGVRRGELINSDLLQLEPREPDELRRVHMAKLRRVRG
jgi:integrase/recombinase XerC